MLMERRKRKNAARRSTPLSWQRRKSAPAWSPFVCSYPALPCPVSALLVVWLDPNSLNPATALPWEPPMPPPSAAEARKFLSLLATAVPPAAFSSKLSFVGASVSFSGAASVAVAVVVVSKDEESPPHPCRTGGTVCSSGMFWPWVSFWSAEPPENRPQGHLNGI